MLKSESCFISTGLGSKRSGSAAFGIPQPARWSWGLDASSNAGDRETYIKTLGQPWLEMVS